MGEAGPEAIMPLTRGPNGKLGVAANGDSGSRAPQDINIKVDVTGARGSQEISDAVNEGVGRALNAYRGSIAQVNDVAAASKKAGMRRLGR
jgi:phage-related minor tail protein